MKTSCSLLLALVFASPVLAQTPTTVPQLKAQVAAREQRVNLLRDEIKATDGRIESRLGTMIETLKMISDSQDSRTKVARMKEDTGKQLMKAIQYYDQKRAALREELRNPRLHLTDEEKRRMIAVFDARIAKRTQEIMALHKSMPAPEERERYNVTNGWYGTQYERNEEYDQNRRMTSHANSQRDALVKQLDASLARLDRQARTLKSQIASNPANAKTLHEELARTEALIAERREQKREILSPTGTPTHTVALKEAMDLDKAMQTSINDLRRDFSNLFQRYNTLLGELSSLHAAEAALAKAEQR